MTTDFITRAEFEALKKQVESIKRGTATVQPVATDEDLNSQYGDPVIKFDPREKYWTGESYAGMKFSQCPPEYLDAQARYLGACAYMKRKDGDDKKASYNEKDAARAAGWAKRIRAGWKPQPAVQGDAFEGEDPF